MNNDTDNDVILIIIIVISYILFIIDSNNFSANYTTQEPQ